MNIDDGAMFAMLKDLVNENPAHFSALGEADMACGIAMRHGDGDACFIVTFAGIACSEVAHVSEDELGRADFILDGPLEQWRAMFADIASNGRATGVWTLNSLALLGDRIVLIGTDPMGLDRFSRFNQTLQDYFDGAARLGALVS